MKFKPLNDRVVIAPFESDAKTPGGIVLPDAAKEKPIRGKVLAVGAGYLQNGTRIPLAVNVGDTVLYDARYDHHPISIEDQEVLILQEGQLLGVCG